MKKLLFLFASIVIFFAAKAQSNIVDSVDIQPVKVGNFTLIYIVAVNPFLPTDSTIQFAYTVYDNNDKPVSNGNMDILYTAYDLWREDKKHNPSPGEIIVKILGFTPK